jgi:hypothetical protein
VVAVEPLEPDSKLLSSELVVELVTLLIVDISAPPTSLIGSSNGNLSPKDAFSRIVSVEDRPGHMFECKTDVDKCPAFFVPALDYRVNYAIEWRGTGFEEEDVRESDREPVPRSLP